MDYIYTAFHQDHLDGTPILNPLWYKYPQDTNTFGIDLQYLFGPSILVSPVTEENATSVSAYFPNDIFYDFLTFAPLRGNGSYVTLENITLTAIPVHIRGGAILPLRVQGAMTTTALREEDFELVIAPGLDGTATGALYVDDGVSIVPAAMTQVEMTYANGTLTVSGSFGYNVGVSVARVVLLGAAQSPSLVKLNGEETSEPVVYDAASSVASVAVGLPFNQDFTLQIV